MLTCQLCGRAPAAQVALRRHVGMIVVQRFVRAKPTLCREHGIKISKEFLNKTLVQGWWGIISFFMNIYAVVVDLEALRTFKKLDEPQGKPLEHTETAFPAPVSAASTPPDPEPPVR